MIISKLCKTKLKISKSKLKKKKIFKMPERILNMDINNNNPLETDDNQVNRKKTKEDNIKIDELDKNTSQT